MSGHNILQQLASEPEAVIVDPGNGGTIPIDRTLGVCNLVSDGSQTRVIASPEHSGIILTLAGKTVGGTITISTAGSETVRDGANNHNTIAIDGAGDVVMLISVENGSDYMWAKIVNNGATISTT